MCVVRCIEILYPCFDYFILFDSFPTLNEQQTHTELNFRTHPSLSIFYGNKLGSRFLATGKSEGVNSTQARSNAIRDGAISPLSNGKGDEDEDVDKEVE